MGPGGGSLRRLACSTWLRIEFISMNSLILEKGSIDPIVEPLSSIR